jgi:hypothetical protein
MNRKFQPRQKYTQGALGVINILPVLFFHKNNQYSLGVIMRVILTSKFYFLKSTAIQCNVYFEFAIEFHTMFINSFVDCHFSDVDKIDAHAYVCYEGR